MIKMGMLAVTGAILAVQWKHMKPEYGIYITISVGIIFFYQILGHLKVIIDMLRMMESRFQIETAYIEVIVKMIGITFVGEFASGICKDAGYPSIASNLELLGKLLILSLGIPIIRMMLDVLQGFGI